MDRSELPRCFVQSTKLWGHLVTDFHTTRAKNEHSNQGNY